MKRALFSIAIVVCLLAGLVSANKASGDDGDSITVSPKVLILEKPGSSFSIHSNIDYSSVNIGTLKLTIGGKEIESFRSSADSIGDLVIKLKRQVVEDIATPGTMTVTLEGERIDGSAIDVSDTITVKPAGKKQQGKE